jgi:hypothetical protein
MPAPKPAREVEFEVLGKDAPQGRLNDDPFIALIARLMDDIFVIPGTNIRFGLDPLIGLIPALGATASSFVSIVLIALSARRGVPKVVLTRMAVNVLANAAIDSVPVLGDVASVFYRSNSRNYELLRKHAGTVRPSTTGDWLFLIGLLAGVLLVIGLIIVGSVTLLRALLLPSTPQ